MGSRKKSPGSSTAGSKALLTVLALLGTFGGWAYFAAEGATELSPTPTPRTITLDLPPIPTLVPIRQTVAMELDEDREQATPAPPVLRQVNQPASVGSSSGGGGRSAARTRSSR